MRCLFITRGNSMQILRVSMNNQKVSFEKLPEEWKYLGGSALIAKILQQRSPAALRSAGRGKQLHRRLRPAGRHAGAADGAYLRRRQKSSDAGDQRSQLGRPGRTIPRSAGNPRHCLFRAAPRDREAYTVCSLQRTRPSCCRPKNTAA